jgi:hypothetical protein
MSNVVLISPVLDAMISNEELDFMQKEYERILAVEESREKPIQKKIQKLHGMVCFLGAWGIV